MDSQEKFEYWLDILTLFRLKRIYAREAVYIEPHTFATYHLYNDNPFVKEVLRTGREIL
jgi:hypothetical protein